MNSAYQTRGILHSIFKINHIFFRNSNSNIQSADGQLLVVQFKNALIMLIKYVYCQLNHASSFLKVINKHTSHELVKYVLTNDPCIPYLNPYLFCAPESLIPF